MCGGAVRGDDRSANEVSEQPVTGGGVMAAVVDIDRFTRGVENVDGVERTRFERFLEKWIPVRRALLERRSVVDGNRLLGRSKRAGRVVLVRLKHVDIRDAPRRKQLLHQYRCVAPIRCDVLVNSGAGTRSYPRCDVDR